MEPDVGTTYTTNMRGGFGGAIAPDGTNEQQQQQQQGVLDATGYDPLDEVKPLFKHFLAHYRFHNFGSDFCYSEQLQMNLSVRLRFLEVDMVHIQEFHEGLAVSVKQSPSRSLHHMEEAASEFAAERKLFTIQDVQRGIQIQLFWGATPIPIRQLAHEEISRLVVLGGIVVKCNNVQPRCVRATIQCTSCRAQTTVSGGRTIDLPQQCHANGEAAGRNKCRPNPYVLLVDQCEYEDQQVLKLQELPEDVPTGELPRHTTLVVDRYLVDRVAPGFRIHLLGIVSVYDRRDMGVQRGKRNAGAGLVAGLRAQYLRCVGIMRAAGNTVVSINRNFSSKFRSRTRSAWQPEDEAEFKRFARQNNVYEIIAEGIDPAVYGLKDQKKAIACLLFGGTRKQQDGNFRRGDIHVLFVGDPATAKSQLLKFTEKIAPIGIYTSGKGSSAAGLTATVVGGGTGEFWLEAGSLVLADGGVVCIDEFDKMREQDQVAIHEAMEQQTISIAKANLSTMLNSRTSVLAAANPILGSYDPLQTNEEQLDFQSSILSRFDLIFKVLDPRDPARDRMLARHVVNLHKGKISAQDGPGNRHSTNPGGNAPLSFLTKYIAYARATCRPTLSEDTFQTLLDFFVVVRRDAHAANMEAMMAASAKSHGGGAPLIQITPRQLESLIRISEALAKMRLDPKTSVRDAQEAIRIFRVSTVDAITTGLVENNLTEIQGESIVKIEDAIRHRVVVGATVQHIRLVNELVRLGFESRLIERAISVMIRRDELEMRKQRTLIYRLR